MRPDANRLTRRALLTAAGTVLAAQTGVRARTRPAHERTGCLRAGFSRVKITPPVGTRMMGFGDRDRSGGCTGVRDDLYVRTVYVEHAGRAVLIAGFDLCFLGRADADRLKGALGRRLDLAAAQVLLNASHTHAGPAVGTWYWAGYLPPETLYLSELEAATVAAACEARDTARPVTMWAGATRTRLPMNRRAGGDRGEIENRPNPEGNVYDEVPICVLREAPSAGATPVSAGPVVALLFSVACHPSIIGGHEVSADYPGAVMAALDAHLGRSASLFLQGAGGDAKPCVIRDGRRWRAGDGADLERCGRMVSAEIIERLNRGLAPIEPHVAWRSIETNWPLGPLPARSEYEAIAADADAPEIRRLWARRQLDRIRRHGTLPANVTLTVQGIRLGRGVRLVGVEGELTAGLGRIVREAFPDGCTFVLGYCNGEGLYLPTSHMIDEGGYEVVSYWEYGWPAPLAKGTESVMSRAVEDLRAAGI